MNNLTPAQQKVIQTWTEQRDALSREIGQLTVERDDLRKSTNESSLALTDINKSIAEARGRIAEIDALETRMRGSLATDVAELEVRKSRLEGECAVLDEKLKGGNEKYEIITTAIGQLSAAHDTMKDQAAIVDKVVGEIIQTSQTHTSEMKTIMDDIRTVSIDVIEKGNANIANTNELMEIVPRFVQKLQKAIAGRRQYPVDHPNFVKPD